MLIACLLVVPLVACSQSRKPANHTAPVVTAAPTPVPDSELRLPPPSLLYRLYETTAAVLDATWSNKDTGDSSILIFPLDTQSLGWLLSNPLFFFRITEHTFFSQEKQFKNPSS